MPNEFADPSPTPVADATADQNPYASPRAQGPLLGVEESEPIGIWRNGDRLIMHKSAALPPRCIRTNAFCERSERRQFTINSDSANRWALSIPVPIGVAIAIGGYMLLQIPGAHYFAGMVMLLALLIELLFVFRIGKETTIVFYHSEA